MTFDEVLNDASGLADSIRAASFKPDYLVGLARGGWIPTRLLSNYLGVKEILSIGMKYADAERTQLVAYSAPDPMPKGKKLLLIEDCLESGKSMVAARELLIAAGNEVKTASIYIIEKTQNLPDFYLKKLPQPPLFPWEKLSCK